LTGVRRDDQRLDPEARVRASVLDDLGRLGAQRVAPGASRRQRHRDRHGNLRGLTTHRACLLPECGDPAPSRAAATRRRHPPPPGRAAGRMAGGLTPPTTIGIVGFCNGVGENFIPSKREYLPSNFGSSWLHNARMTAMASSVKGPRSAYGLPIARISFSMSPTPAPMMSRPPLSTSSVAAAFASRTGLWYGSTRAAVPRRTRRVRAAT